MIIIKSNFTLSQYIIIKKHRLYYIICVFLPDKFYNKGINVTYIPVKIAVVITPHMFALMAYSRIKL